MPSCHRYGCGRPAVVRVIFPTLKKETLACEKHRPELWQTFEEGRDKANETIMGAGLGRLKPEEGPQWEEL